MLTAAQHDIRKTGLGASDLPAALGLDRYRTPLDVYCEKTGIVPAPPGTVHTRLGDLLEPVILTLYAEQLDIDVFPSPGTLRHPTEPWLLATPDALGAPRGPGLAILPGGRVCDRVVEAKHRGHWNRTGWGVAGTDEVPDSVAIQVHAQLAVTGFAVGDVGVLLGGSDLRFYRVHADPDLTAGLLEMGRHFWVHHVQARVMPPPTAADNESLGRLLRQTHEQLKPSTPEIDAELLTLRDVRRELDELGRTKEAIEARVKAFIAEAPGLTSCVGTCTWRQAKDTRVTDWKALADAAKRHDLIPQFSTTRPGSRRFLVSFPEGE